MMSDYEVTVNNFIHLLKTQLELFSKQDKTNLIKLLNSQSDDIQSLSNTISDWCEKHPQVDDALAELEANVTERAPGSTKANSNIPKYELYKRTLIKASSQAQPGNQLNGYCSLYCLCKTRNSSTVNPVTLDISSKAMPVLSRLIATCCKVSALPSCLPSAFPSAFPSCKIS